MNYVLTIKIPIEAKDDNDARKEVIHLPFLKWLATSDGTITLHELKENIPIRRVIIKEK